VETMTRQKGAAVSEVNDGSGVIEAAAQLMEETASFHPLRRHIVTKEMVGAEVFQAFQELSIRPFTPWSVRWFRLVKRLEMARGIFKTLFDKSILWVGAGFFFFGLLGGIVGWNDALPCSIAGLIFPPICAVVIFFSVFASNKWRLGNFHHFQGDIPPAVHELACAIGEKLNIACLFVNALGSDPLLAVGCNRKIIYIAVWN